MMVGLFCIAVIAVVVIFIGRKQLDIVIGSSVLGVAGIPILPLAIML